MHLIKVQIAAMQVHPLQGRPPRHQAKPNLTAVIAQVLLLAKQGSRLSQLKMLKQVLTWSQQKKRQLVASSVRIVNLS